MTDYLQPGDIWQHESMGRLYVSGEESTVCPGYLKCYWGMGGNSNAPWTFMNPSMTKHLTLIGRLGVQGENGQWSLKR
jgi:hypothetical protein